MIRLYSAMGIVLVSFGLITASPAEAKVVDCGSCDVRQCQNSAGCGGYSNGTTCITEGGSTTCFCHSDEHLAGGNPRVLPGVGDAGQAPYVCSTSQVCYVVRFGIVVGKKPCAKAIEAVLD